MRNLTIIILLVFFAASPVAAQIQDTRGHLFGQVRVDRVVEVAATVGMFENSRGWTGADAQYAAAFAKTFEVDFIAETRIQAWSWDWLRGRARTDFTPMLFSIVAKEQWYKDGVPVAFEAWNTFACYEVKLGDTVHCHQFQGTSSDHNMGSHINYIRMERAELGRMIDILIVQPSTHADSQENSPMETIHITDPQFVYGLLGVIVLAALAVVAYAQNSKNAQAAVFAELFKPLVETVKVMVDKQLAPYGGMLQPIHTGAGVLESLVDEPTDKLRALLTPIIADIVLQVAQTAQELTDGVPAQSYGVPEPDTVTDLPTPEQEHIPAGSPGEASK